MKRTSGSERSGGLSSMRLNKTVSATTTATPMQRAAPVKKGWLANFPTNFTN